jgi:hypothetical protein
MLPVIDADEVGSFHRLVVEVSMAHEDLELGSFRLAADTSPPVVITPGVPGIAPLAIPLPFVVPEPGTYRLTIGLNGVETAQLPLIVTPLEPPPTTRSARAARPSTKKASTRGRAKPRG